MSDQAAPLEGEPTAAIDTPEVTGTEPQPQENWEERYKEGQAWNTRLSQELAQLKAAQKDPEQVTREWLSQNGYTLPNDQPDEWQDPTEGLRAEVAELKQWRDSMTATEQRNEAYAAYRQDVDPQLKGMGVPDSFLQTVADIAFNEMPALETPHGPMPDLQGAVERFTQVGQQFAAVPQVRDQVLREWRNTKPRTAFTSAQGTEGTQVPDLSTREGKEAYILARLQADQD